MSRLRRSMLEGLAWRSAADFGQLVLQIVFTAVLAHLLTKADFGLIALAMLTTRLLTALTTIGFGTAVIQSQSATPGAVAAVFYLQIAVRTTVALVCVAVAPLVAGFFGEPAVIPVIRVMAITITLHAFSFPQVILQKQLKFRGFSALELGAMVVSNAVGIGFAVAGHGVWSLVYRAICYRAIHVVGVWWIARWVPARPAWRESRPLVRFGVQMLGANMCKYVSQNMAGIVIGRVLGVETLGAYNIAHNLAIAPAQRLYQILVSVLMPTLAKVQLDREGLARRVQTALFSFAALFLPLMIGLAAVGMRFVHVVFGDKWEEAGLLVTALAMAGLLRGIDHMLRAVLIATGRASTVFRISVVEAAAAVVLFTAGTYFFGIHGVLAACVATAAIPLIFATRPAIESALARESILWSATARTWLAAGLMLFCVILYGLATSATPVQLAAQIAIGALVYFIARRHWLTDRERAMVRTLPLGSLVAGPK
ncbi:MAG: lipopolysaccharide biosynthesis protein [Planctomycetota bacterium]|nr:lipopolysaccharide biosynthesis protein [Planctomycetota bacterium]